MNTNKNLTAAAVAATLVTGVALAPAAAMAQTSRQNDKNTTRNIGVGLGGAALLQALRGKGTSALILGAGAAYAGKKYEDARKAQDKENSESAIDTQYNTVNVRVNDQAVSFADQKPVVIGGRAYVPMRGVLERLGADVRWDAQNKMVTAYGDGKTVRLPSNGPATVDGKQVNLDAPAFVQNGRVYVPLRFFAETFGAEVAYDKDQNVVRINEDKSS